MADAYKSPEAMKIDESLYSIKDDAAAFLKQLTGIKDDEELKQHILSVQRVAFAVRAYFHSDYRDSMWYTGLSILLHPSIQLLNVKQPIARL